MHNAQISLILLLHVHCIRLCHHIRFQQGLRPRTVKKLRRLSDVIFVLAFILQIQSMTFKNYVMKSISGCSTWFYSLNIM